MKRMKMKNKVIVILILAFTITSALSQTINVNGIRDFLIDQSTQVKVDGETVIEFPFEIIGTGGYKIRFTVDSDVNATISQGTITEINILTDIKGPVTQLNPLEIMDQQVYVTADTTLENLLSTDDLSLGDMVSVSGSINEADNSMQLSRLELLDTLDRWRLRGFARNITATEFTIGGLTINRNSVTPLNCDDGFIENVFVSVKSDPDSNYITLGNGILTTLTDLECDIPDVEITPGNHFIPVVVEGFVSEIIDLSSVRINDLTVYFDDNTEFDNGELEHLDVGTNIEVQGLLDTDTGNVNADTIRFINPRVKIEAPVNPADITLNHSIMVFGQELLMTPQTRDEDSILASGLAQPRQVEIRGFVDADGQIFMQRVRDRGDVDYDDVTLRGVLTSFSSPNLSINNVAIDSSGSLFEIDDQFVDMAAFFGQLLVDMQLEISGAHYDSVANELSSGTLELIEAETEDDPDSVPDVVKATGDFSKEIIGTGGVGFATITGTGLIYKNSFE